MSHAAVSTLCRSIKLQCELYSSRQIAICLDPYCGLGFVLWCLSRYVKGCINDDAQCICCKSDCVGGGQCLLRSPVNPHPALGAGELTSSVAEHTQSVQDPRHLLLLLSHGALHQRPWDPDGAAEGWSFSIVFAVFVKHFHSTQKSPVPKDALI